MFVSLCFWFFLCSHLILSRLSVFQPQSALMDLMDVPEPRATSDPWSARAGAGGGSADPWHAHGKLNAVTIRKDKEGVCVCVCLRRNLCSPPAAPRTEPLCLTGMLLFWLSSISGLGAGRFIRFDKKRLVRGRVDSF